MCLEDVRRDGRHGEAVNQAQGRQGSLGPFIRSGPDTYFFGAADLPVLAPLLGAAFT